MFWAEWYIQDAHTTIHASVYCYKYIHYSTTVIIHAHTTHTQIYEHANVYCYKYIYYRYKDHETRGFCTFEAGHKTVLHHCYDALILTYTSATNVASVTHLYKLRQLQ